MEQKKIALIGCGGMGTGHLRSYRNIPNAKIVFITGEEMATGLNGFYEILKSYNPKAIGGNVPAESIYIK